ncbi:hypothetical protein MY1884_004484 [Beauveria asiatica]
MAGIQLAKLSGLTVITTCSPANFDLVKALGASAAFDYNSPTCAADIKAFTNNALLHAWDCTGDGAGVCAAAMSDNDGGTYGTIMPADYELLARTNPRVTGQPFDLVRPDPAEMECYEFFLGITQPLLESGQVRPLRAALNKTGSGLEGVLKGLEKMQAGVTVSGEKLVYTI